MTFSIERFQTAPTSIDQLRFHWTISGKGQTRAGPTRRQTLAKCHGLGENGENGSFTPAHLTLVALDHAAFHSTRYRYMRRVPVSSSPTPPKMKMFNVFHMSSSISVCVCGLHAITHKKLSFLNEKQKGGDQKQENVTVFESGQKDLE